MAENTAEKARTVSLNPKEVPKDTMREIEDPTLRKKILTLLESAGIKNGALRLYWEPGKIQISFLEEHSTHPILELELR